MNIQPQYMHRCLQLAALGNGFVAPNPLVGAVLVHNNRIIGEGWHKRYGEAHAEVICLESVAPEDRQLIPESSLYVSLEPCAHFGKTPPCAHRIVKEGIKQVIVGIGDPFKRVNGKGIEILREAGVAVMVGLLEKECRWQNRRFFTFHEKKRPYIHLKWAETSDGFMGSGHSGRLIITHPLASRWVHRWRSEEAAIMAGTETARLDNPSLNNRYWWGAQPLRVVPDRSLELPQNLTLFNDGGAVMILNAAKEELTGSVQFKRVQGLETGDPHKIIQALFEANIQSVLIEGGARLLNSFIQAGLWDEAHIIKNTRMVQGSGLKAPLLPGGLHKETRVLQQDRMDWVINS